VKTLQRCRDAIWQITCTGNSNPATYWQVNCSHVLQLSHNADTN